MTFKNSYLLLFIFLLSQSLNSKAQEKVVPIPYGNMDRWMVREIKESLIIGGNTRYLYAITDYKDTLKHNAPYLDTRSPWATSSVLAIIKGITKGSVTVFPERRGAGYAARMETRIERVKVLGLVNISVLASGAIFLGQMLEPIRDTKNPQSKLVTGIPFSGKPRYLQFDYKVITGGQKRRINGFSEEGTLLNEKDKAEVQILLQKRWEDKDGNVHALRIGTGWERFDHTVPAWQNNHRIAIRYGNITGTSFYENYMRLRKGDEAYYTRNSKGKMVPIIEEGWGNSGEQATHLILQFASSNGGAYIGNPESKFWIDNVSLVY